MYRLSCSAVVFKGSRKNLNMEIILHKFAYIDFPFAEFGSQEMNRLKTCSKFSS